MDISFLQLPSHIYIKKSQICCILKISFTLYQKIPDIVSVLCHVALGPRVKLLIISLAGRRNALDLAPQLPPVAVHVILVMVKSVER